MRVLKRPLVVELLELGITQSALDEVGVPVGSLEAQSSLQQLADALFSLFIPGQFRAVGSYYRTFRQVRDDDVVRLLGARPA